MSDNKKNKGTWAQRFFVIFLSLVAGILLFWSLGFITEDIGSLRGPDFSEVRAKYVNADLLEKQKSLKENLKDILRNIQNQQEQRKILKDGTDNLQNTINQLLSIQKQSIEKNLDFPPENQQTLNESQKLFLENQKQYQALNKQFTELAGQQHKLEGELASVSGQIDEQNNLALKEFDGLMTRHRWKVAALKLAFMVPIFLVAAWFFLKKRSGTYGPIAYAAFIAAFVRISFIVHEYFPKRYFKYIAISVIIAIVLRLLVYLIKRVVSPKKDLLIKQRQEAYDRNICPICSKPLRIGPLRYGIRGKSSRLLFAGQVTEAVKQHLYTCPSCGTQLYEKCDKCSDIRHSLLPFCEHCGNEKANWSQ